MSTDLGRRRTGFGKGDVVHVAYPYDVTGTVDSIVLTTGEVIVMKEDGKRLFVKYCFCTMVERAKDDQ